MSSAVEGDPRPSAAREDRRLPRQFLTRRFAFAHRWLLLFLYAVTVGVWLVTSRESAVTAFIFLVLAGGYFATGEVARRLPRYLAHPTDARAAAWRRRLADVCGFVSQRFVRETVFRHTLLFVLGVWIVQITPLLFHQSAVIGGGSRLWVLYFVPILTISRLGTTEQWIRTILAVSFAMITRLVLALATQAGAGRVDLPAEVGVSVVIPGIVLGCVGASVLLLTRRLQTVEAQSALGFVVAARLAKKESFADAYRELATDIRRIHNPPVDFVLILIWDAERRRLRTVGASGIAEDVWRTIELTEDQGIVGRAFRTGRPVRVDDRFTRDVRNVYVEPPDFHDVRSALAVPILYEGEPIGVIDVEQKHEIGAFNDQDQESLENWANVLAVSFGHLLDREARVAKSLRLAVDILDVARPGRPIGDWFAEVATRAAEALGASGVALLRLAPGTQNPLLPPLVWPKSMGGLRRFGAPRPVPGGSVLWALLQDWEIRCWDGAADWGELNNPADRWVRAWLGNGSARSAVFVPVGSAETPLACLFLAYPDRRAASLSANQRFALITFAMALEKSYRSVVPDLTAPRRIALSVHHAVTASPQWSAHRLAKLRAVLGDNPVALEHLQGIEAHLRELRATIKRATWAEENDPTEKPLNAALTSCFQVFTDGPDPAVEINAELDPALECEAMETRLLVYWVTAEAVTNAVHRGRARNVRVQTRRLRRAIQVVVADDGEGLPSQPKRGTPSGIYGLRRIIRAEMGGELTIAPDAPRGVKVTVHLPTVPRPVPADSEGGPCET